MQNNRKIEFFFPGWTKKSITFTIDDGNVEMDRKFLSIVRPAGIIGTFNLVTTDRMTSAEYREFYMGYEIANHCKLHPEAFIDGFVYNPTDDAYDPNTSERYTQENPIVYKTATDNVFMFNDCKTDIRPRGWTRITDADTYFALSEQSRRELSEVFGEGSVKGFVWPYCEQKNKKLVELLKGAGYNSMRKTGELGGTTGFDFPKDRMAWTYNATNASLLRIMEEYEALVDDGKLKFFSFGVHSVDFERDNNWNDLQLFADKYGNRPNDYYYASVSTLFEYEDAVAAIECADKKITNPTDKTVFLSVDGKRVTLSPYSSCTI
jgi:hypothetical protein